MARASPRTPWYAIEGVPIGVVFAAIIVIFMFTAPRSFQGLRIYMSFLATVPPPLILGLGLGAREAIRARATALRGLATRSKPILGATFLAVGLMLLFRVHHVIEGWLLGVLPAWLIDLSVSV